MTSAWPHALANGWHPIAYAREVESKIFRAVLMGRPLAMYRKAGRVEIIADSGGDGGQARRPDPGSCSKAFPAVEAAGLIWTSIARQPTAFPELPLEIEDPRYDGFWWRLAPAKANILDAIENYLDPIHSYFLHSGLVRRPGARMVMDVDMVADSRGCEVRYLEHRDSTTWISRLFERHRSYSYGRYRAPAIAQLAFEDSEGLTIAVSVIFSPEDEGRTRPFAHFATRKGLLPAWVKKPLLKAFHRPILAQDCRMLAWQSETIGHFGRPDYAVVSLDIFGPVIWCLVNGREQKPEARKLELVF